MDDTNECGKGELRLLSSSSSSCYPCYPIFEVYCVCIVCMVVRNINVYHWFDKLFTGVYFVLATMRVVSVWMTMQKRLSLLL